jgi:hypothetical protein
MIVWHYTTIEYAVMIRAAGKIVRATAGVPVQEQPIVWFSKNRAWEPTASKGFLNPSGASRTATFPEMVRVGIARFGVNESELLPWKVLWPAANIAESTAKALERAARKLGARPLDWFGSLADVPVDQVVSVEFYSGDRWQPVP